MRHPSTLLLVIRFFPIPFVGGILFAALALYGLMTFHPTPAYMGVSNLSDTIGEPGYFLGLLTGLWFVVWAWNKAARVRQTF